MSESHTAPALSRLCGIFLIRPSILDLKGCYNETPQNVPITITVTVNGLMKDRLDNVVAMFACFFFWGGGETNNLENLLSKYGIQYFDDWR